MSCFCITFYSFGNELQIFFQVVSHSGEVHYFISLLYANYSLLLDVGLSPRSIAYSYSSALLWVLSKNGKNPASADVGLVFIAYNLKRILSLMGKKGFREVYGLLILCLYVLIQAFKAILIALYPTDTVNPNFFPNPKFKKLILVHNWQ